MFGHMWTCLKCSWHLSQILTFDIYNYIKCVEVNGWIMNKPFHDYGEYVIIIMATICRRQSPIRAGLYSLHNGLGVASVVLSVFVTEKKRSILWARAQLSAPASRVMTNKDSGHHPSCCGGWCSLFQPDFIYITYIWEKLRMFRYYISSVVVCMVGCIIIRTMLYFVEISLTEHNFSIFVLSIHNNGRTE